MFPTRVESLFKKKGKAKLRYVNLSSASTLAADVVAADVVAGAGMVETSSLSIY